MAFGMDAYMALARRRESGGNDNARNPASSASGRFQFLTPTYLSYARKANPGVSDRDLMARKNDPEVQDATMRAFTQDNVNHLAANGIEANNGSAYAAHFLGPAGAVKALKADPSTPIGDVVDAAAIAANPGVFKNISTAGDFAKWAGAYGAGGGDAQAQADMPAPGAQEAQLPGQAPQKEYNFWNGGPGALFGMPQEGWNAGDAMMGVASSLMARDNPTGAQALAAQITKKNNALGKSVVRTDPKTGQVTVYDPTTNSFKTQKVFDREPEQPSQRTVEAFNDNMLKVNAYGNIANKMDRYRRMLANGEIDVSFLSQTTKAWDEINDKGLSPQQQNAVAMMRDFKIMADESLKANKGVQTEGDAQRALALFKPGGTGGLSNSSLMVYLDKGFADASRQYSENVDRNGAYYRRYGDRVGPIDWDKSVEAQKKVYTDAEASFSPIREKYSKQRENPAGAPAPITGNPKKDGAAKPSGGGGFYDHMRK